MYRIFASLLTASVITTLSAAMKEMVWHEIDYGIGIASLPDGWNQAEVTDTISIYFPCTGGVQKLRSVATTYRNRDCSIKFEYIIAADTSSLSVDLGKTILETYNFSGYGSNPLMAWTQLGDEYSWKGSLMTEDRAPRDGLWTTDFNRRIVYLRADSGHLHTISAIFPSHKYSSELAHDIMEKIYRSWRVNDRFQIKNDK